MLDAQNAGSAMIWLESDLLKNAGREIDGPDPRLVRQFPVLIPRDFANTNCHADVEGLPKVTGSHVRRKIFIY